MMNTENRALFEVWRNEKEYSTARIKAVFHQRKFINPC